MTKMSKNVHLKIKRKTLIVVLFIYNHSYITDYRFLNVFSFYTVFINFTYNNNNNNNSNYK